MSNSWPIVRLEEHVNKVGSGATPKGGETSYKASGTPLIRSMNVVFFGFKRDGLAYLDDHQAAALKNVEVRAGDVLLNITGASIGRVTRAPKDMEGARVNQHVCIIRPKELLEARFLNAFLSSPNMQDQIWADNYGVTRQALTKQQILDFDVPLPPLNEQKRIADKLDAVLARVDACREHLDRIPVILKRFRQSVLAAATSGKLTEDWRGTSELAGWTTLPLADVCLSITDGDHQAPPQAETGIPFITISAINDGRLRLEKASRFVPSSYFDALKESRRPKRGDVLFSVTGTIGIPALVETDSAFTFQRHIAILKPDYSKVSSGYLKYALGAEGVQQQALVVATGTAQLTIPLTGLRSFQIDVPSVKEQTDIVRRVEVLFAYADRLEARYSAARAQVEKLTPALLAKAFRGELVPQDPNDEPASALLTRIRAQKAMGENSGNKKRNGRKKNA